LGQRALGGQRGIGQFCECRLTVPQSKIDSLASVGPGMAQILSIGRCTYLHLSSKGGSLLLYLERAGIDANRRNLPPAESACPLHLSRSHSARQVGSDGGKE